MKTLTIAFALALAFSMLSSPAQNAPGGRRGRAEQASPEKIAARMVAKFDANKDGELSQEELVPAIEFMRERHRGGSQAKSGQEGAGTAGEHAAPSADKAAAHWIEKFSSDKKGLTVADLAKAIAERRANRGGAGTGTSQ